MTFEVRRTTPAPSPLRTDVAGVIVRAERGSMKLDSAGRALPVRVSGRRDFEATFGALGDDVSGAAVKGYFDNGGEVLWVVRIGGLRPDDPLVPEDRAAWSPLDVSASKGNLEGAKVLRVLATSEGAWANGLEVTIALRTGATPTGTPMADVLVLRNGRMIEHLLSLDPKQFIEEVNGRSALIQVELVESMSREPLSERYSTFECRLQDGKSVQPTHSVYKRAARALLEAPEPAFLFAPVVRDDLGDAATSFYADWVAGAAGALDRLVLVDPPDKASAPSLLGLADALRHLHPELAPSWISSAVMYCPWLEVPSSGAAPPTRPIPPSGHVAGLISRLDRERGAHHTPANAPLTGAVDLVLDFDNAERAILTQSGLNTLRCTRGRGVEVWGGRTLDLDPSRRFLAHRRLLHLLVRAMRAAAEPLVFDSNTPMLRLTFVRALTSVLLEAFRAGALKGTRPEEAFRVACDDATNPPDAYETGHCVAEVDVAPVAPMEFIHLVITLSQDGSLQVLE